MGVANFTFEELTVTSTKLPNYPKTWEELENIQATASKLQKIRDKLGYPIMVDSCYRSAAVNAAVGGASTSAHTKGLAADLRCSGENRTRSLYTLLKSCMEELGIDQLIAYNETAGDFSTPFRFIHVGWRNGVPRKQLLFK